MNPKKAKTRCEHCGGTKTVSLNSGHARLTERQARVWREQHARGVGHQFDNQDLPACDSFHDVPCQDCAE